MIVITRNGRTTVVTGWKAWLLGAVAVCVAWLLLAVIMFLWIGVAITLGAFLLLTVPAILIASMAHVWMRRSER